MKDDDENDRNCGGGWAAEEEGVCGGRGGARFALIYEYYLKATW